MLKRLTHFFACLLLLLMPLQGITAANMSICNSLMQAQDSSPKLTQSQSHMQNMPCHQSIASKHMASMTKSPDSCKHKAACKTSCAALCANLSALNALPSDIKPTSLSATPTVLVAYSQIYVSITQASLQRPPIFFS